MSKHISLEIVMELKRPSAQELAQFRAKRWGRRFNQSTEARAAIRAAKNGKPLSQAHKIAISEGKYRYMPDIYHREAISKGMRRYWAQRKAEAAKRAARVQSYKTQKVARVVSQTSRGERKEIT